ncbi:co-chaperone HscB [Gallaecimonas sp. GXIMD4217]|uniref:co-chaperone HscB n=1 Tax=Gallaecimonas sp. GXIMD4217 TaxID=3131927 RepID=UPI00311AD8EF
MNHFQLFDLPVQFPLDQHQLASRYRELARAVHPDKFAASADRERAMALAKTAQLNDAFETLKCATSRAEYLLSLKGVDIRGESQTLRDPAFLMQQMHWREALEEIEDVDALDGLRAEIQAERQTLEQGFQAQLAEEALDEAADTVRKLKFVDKMHRELDSLEESLLDY